MDVKHLRLPGGLMAYQFTAIDHATRMMKANIYERINSQAAKEFFQRLEEEFPFEQIQYVGSDNGSEFMGELDKELERRKIKHVTSSPRSPRQNPYVERVIRTIIDEVYYYRGLEVTREEQEEVLKKYTRRYNQIRPHHSLEYRTPYEEYVRITQTDSLSNS